MTRMLRDRGGGAENGNQRGPADGRGFHERGHVRLSWLGLRWQSARRASSLNVFTPVAWVKQGDATTEAAPKGAASV
ncbi:MAG: hypothetical protein NVS1B4_15180 [Gemmatimonadaceae bacterium]